jgi:hypothetical protein
MLQKLSEHVATALERAAAAEQRARDAVEPEYRLDNERMAENWRLLAHRFQYVESLEKFLIDSKPHRNLLPPQSPKKHPWE